MLLFYLTILVVSQDYIVEVHNKHIILGNDILVACEIPSFVSDLIDVVAWVDNQGSQFLPSKFGNSTSQ
jgi:hypothetical protein